MSIFDEILSNKQDEGRKVSIGPSVQKFKGLGLALRSMDFERQTIDFKVPHCQFGYTEYIGFIIN